MKYEIIPTPNFSKEFKRLAKKYPSLKEDIRKLTENLKEDPFQGIELFKSCYKIRFAIKSKGKGKSGGGRLITNIAVSNNKVFLIHIFDKSEKENVSDLFLKILLQDLQ
jgi:mRNA-degrading endonuclease RelE of RelBE toxin-antitoxin system